MEENITPSDDKTIREIWIQTDYGLLCCYFEL